MPIDRCLTCGQMVVIYEGSEPHRCPPRWQVMCEESHGDEVVWVYATNPEDAAEQFIKDDSDWLETICDRTVEVKVKVDCTTWKAFSVSGEYEVQYSVTEVK